MRRQRDGQTGRPLSHARHPKFSRSEKLDRGRVACRTGFTNGGTAWTAEALRRALPASIPQTQSTGTVFAEAATGLRDPQIEALLAVPAQELADRSTHFNQAVDAAIGCGMAAGDFEAMCREHPNGCAQKYLQPRDRLREEIERAWQKIVEHDAQCSRLAESVLASWYEKHQPVPIITEIEWIDEIEPALGPNYIIKDILDRGAMAVAYRPV